MRYVSFFCIWCLQGFYLTDYRVCHPIWDPWSFAKASCCYRFIIFYHLVVNHGYLGFLFIRKGFSGGVDPSVWIDLNYHGSGSFCRSISPGKLRKYSLLLFNQSTSFQRLQKSAKWCYDDTIHNGGRCRRRKKKKAERYIFFFRHDCPQSGCNNNTAKLRLCLESFGILAQESEIFHSSMERPRRVSSLSPKHFFFVQRATTVWSFIFCLSPLYIIKRDTIHAKFW